MDEKRLKSISNVATTALFLLLVLAFGFLWGEFKAASGLNAAEPVESGLKAATIKPVYKTGETAIGKTLFISNCGRCHMIERKFTGPALMNVKDRWADSTHLYAWIKNSQQFLATGDQYATTLYKEYNSIMPAFPDLDDAEIREILYYVDPENMISKLAD